ncbi:MAG: YitT family protein, partial [Alistipes sp.]|nr:YitT family protein [Alistipes sp.]
DFVQSGNQQSNQIMIFCKDYEAMAEMIKIKANRGATLIDAMGWYTKTPSKAVMVVCRKRDTSMILKLVREQDSNAFLTVGSVMGVYGQGFDALNKL